MIQEQSTQARYDAWIRIREEICARSPGWYIAECSLCDSYATGSEPTVEDWGWEHVEDHVQDSLDAGFPG